MPLDADNFPGSYLRMCGVQDDQLYTVSLDAYVRSVAIQTAANTARLYREFTLGGEDHANDSATPWHINSSIVRPGGHNGTSKRATERARYKARHPDQVAASKARYYARYPEKAREEMRRAYAKNKARYKAAARAWAKRNPEKALASKLAIRMGVPAKAIPQALLAAKLAHLEVVRLLKEKHDDEKE